MENKDVRQLQPFSAAEGLSLTLGYLEDPSSVECPSCGAGQVEIVAYVDPDALASGKVVKINPDSDYAVLLLCHGCTRAAAIHLTYRERQQNREAA